MIKLVCVSLALLCIPSAWSQVVPTAAGGEVLTEDSEQMVIPPPISVMPYPTEVGSEMKKNYWSGGMIFTAAYNDNVMPGFAPVPISDFTYFIWPTISVQQQTGRKTLAVTYAPGFEFYQKTSALNAIPPEVAELIRPGTWERVG